MCARYYIEPNQSNLAELKALQEKQQTSMIEQLTIKSSGEIFPSDTVYVLIGENEYLPMRWGFMSYDKKLLINARSETVFQKPTFKLTKPCLIPASGFYEWAKVDKQKTKYRLFSPEEPLYFAGRYRVEENNPLPSFVILTKDSDENISFIHHRMPVIIPFELTNSWLSGKLSTFNNLKTELNYTKC